MSQINRLKIQLLKAQIHDNVVRDFETIDIKKGLDTEGEHLTNPSKNWRIQNCTLIVFLQDKKTGEVLGAAKIGL